MVSKVLRRLMRVAAMLAGATLVLAGSADATRPVRRTARPAAARGFNLFAGQVNVLINVNRVECNINNIGESCVNGTNSPSLAGGFWPRGTGNQYIFNAGLQIAGIVGTRTGTTNPWDGDTVGAFFFDPRGDQAHGEGRTNVFNNLSTADQAEWPDAANIRDTALFHPALVSTTFGGLATSERQAISQQDTWVRFWDGNTNLTTGRQHPMGLLVEQRGLAWNFPSGNQDILYFLYRFINISSVNAADYAGLLNQGYTAADITEIVSIATEFQQRSEAAFNVDIPPGGYPFNNLFAAFAQDPDVTAAAGNNFSSANLVFGVGSVYSGSWQAEASFVYPPDINGAPFANAPGFEGVKYLKSPVNPATGNEVGLTMFGNTTNGGAFPDSRGVQQLWRRISANLTAVDGTCSVPNPAVRRFCFVNQAVADTRFFQSSGPFTLNPGEAAVIVVAYIHAAPLGTAPAATPPFGPPIPAFTLPIGTVTPPGLPMAGDRLFAGTDLVKTYDRAMGWLNHSDVDGDGIIEQCTRDAGTVPAAGPPGSIPSRPCITEVVTQPRSLLNKTLVAQAVFDNKFLLPFAPDSPTFFLIPGDNQVTVAWERSATETIGDPYFGIASNAQSALFDPNFRRFDVEGYRIWRGRTQATLEVIAAFDYAGTTITDFTGQFFIAANYGNRCAPELGLTTGATTGTCPVAFLTSAQIQAGRLGPPANPAFTGPTFPIPLSGDVIQIPPGGRVQLASGNVLITSADTAATGGGTGFPSLVDNGVPFVYVDTDVRSGFRYFYAVTAFDVNSVASGPSSLESPLVTKTVTPRAGSSNPVTAEDFSVEMVGDDGVALNPNAAYPSIDAANGTLNGPIPPANGGSFGFVAFVAEALPVGGTAKWVIDSVMAGFPSDVGFAPAGHTMFGRFIAGPDTIPRSIFMTTPSFASLATAAQHFDISAPLVGYDPVGAAALGIVVTPNLRMPVLFSQTVTSLSISSPAIALEALRFGEATATDAHLSHSYWTNLGAAQPADPTASFAASASHNAGQLTGVTRIYAPSSYRYFTEAVAAGSRMNSINTRYRNQGYASGVWYPADIIVTWGAAGAVTVRDSTHRVNLRYSPALNSGTYGFINASAYAATAATNLCSADGLTFVAGPPAQCQGNGVGVFPSPSRIGYRHYYYVPPINATRGVAARNLGATATLDSLDLNNDGLFDGMGLVMVINAEMFMFETAALPAAGTQWHLRATGGAGMTVTSCDQTLALDMTTPATDCSGYTFDPPPVRPAYAPGLTYQITINARRSFDASTSTDLSAVHTVPDPYYVTNNLEITANTKVLRFVNLPSQAIVRIYSASGVLVNIVSHNDVTGGGEAVWNLRNRNNQFVASGVYFFHVETADGRQRVGRFTVVNFAQ